MFDVLTTDNSKLGGSLIWGFALPSGTEETCPGMTEVCRYHCYARHMEAWRESVRRRWQKNLELVKGSLEAWQWLVGDCIERNEIRVVRMAVGGDFISPEYVRAWRRVARKYPGVRFFTYTRCWRVEEFREELGRLARERNVRLWWSCDRESGVPPRRKVPGRVRLAWLQTAEGDPPPGGKVDLVFRVQKLRKGRRVKEGGVVVCPEEAGLGRDVTCSSCQKCFLKLPGDRAEGERHGRLSLEVV